LKKIVSACVCAVMLLSAFPLTVNMNGVKFSTIDVVSAASAAETTTPKATTPKATTPKATTPKATTPKATTPKATTPKATTPKATTPKATTPKATTPKATTPKATTPKVTTPKATTPKVTTPKATTPKVKEVTTSVNPYIDGVYVTYGDAYLKGTEGAKVTIKDGKVSAVEFIRSSPMLIDRDVRFNYSGLWQAYEIMKTRIIGKTKEQVTDVDVVSGATRSSEGWKLSVDRAFVRALKVKPAGEVYFEGKHMGVDPEGKFMVFARYDKSKLLGIKVYPLNSKGEAIDETAMTSEQAKLVYTLANELLYKGTNASVMKGYEMDSRAAINALWDADQNAKLNNVSKYVDGFYSAYGTARDKGVERADIVIRNGKLVDVKLYRLGSNLLDRGNTAYAEVVKANPLMVAKLLEEGSYVADYSDEVDAISGATESSHSWNLAVQRAFEKALKVPNKSKYFEGIFAGVDSQSKVLVLVDMNTDNVTKTTIYLTGEDKKLIKETDLNDEQKAVVTKLSEGLTKAGLQMASIAGQETLSIAAKAAFEDAMKNASKKQGNYKDGIFTAYGDATGNGTNRADVILRNGNIVDINLSRVGPNLVDRGETAYAEVVKAIPVLENEFVIATTRKNAEKVDAISGATSSSEAFVAAVDRAYKKAEISEPYRAAFLNGIYGGVNSEKSVYVMVTVEKNVPVQMLVNYLDENGKVKKDEQLSVNEKAVKMEIETPTTGTMHKYAYRPAAFGETDSVKAISTKVVDAIKVALESAGR
jgi:uncharacterized protein with FMN-binding domain